MRFAASPILVAVALGLLGPVALDDEEDDTGAVEELAAQAAAEPGPE